MGRAERRRLEKEQNRKPVYYQYTPQQINMLRKQAVQDSKDRIAAYAKEAVQQEWERREKAIKGETTEETVQLVLCLLMAVPAKILCEKFGWQPVDEKSDNRSRLKRFSESVVSEVNRICGDETVDIREYAKEVYEECGVMFQVE